MKGIWLVLKKELIEFTKDRKTMFFTLALPVVLYPLLFGMIGKMVSREVQQARSSQTRIALIDSSKVLEQFLQSRPDDFKLVPVPDGDVKQAIKDDQLEMLVTLESSAFQDMAEHRTIPVNVLYNKVEKTGQVGMKRLEDVLQELDKTTVQSRLLKLGASTQLAMPTEIHSQQVGGAELALAKLLGTMLPYILMLMLFTGSMQLGIYVTAGERERGTLITLLATGLPRHEIIWGKMLYVFFMGIIISIINIASMAFSMGTLFGSMETKAEYAAMAGQEAVQSMSIASVADPTIIALTLLLMLPLGLMFSNLIILLGIQAKNSQEAGTAMIPLMLLVVALSIFSMMPGIEKVGLLPYIPIVNISLAIRKLFVQQAGVLEYLIAFFMTVAMAALLTYISTKLLSRESAIFKST
ncbi:MAG: ABC transporter permease [Holophagales bacterium]|jgi:sodium transport system permease protein|nr:ABC transporter permease [Holophagales bacterium]